MSFFKFDQKTTNFLKLKVYNKNRKGKDMTIYLDIVFIENIIMNYIILYATNYILKRKIKNTRILISSIIGATYSILLYLGIFKIYSNIIMKIILSIVMVYIAVPTRNLLKEILLFYLVSFVFGGSAFALLYVIKPQEIFSFNGVLIGSYPLKIAIIGGIVGFFITTISFRVIKSRNKKKRYDVRLTE